MVHVEEERHALLRTVDFESVDDVQVRLARLERPRRIHLQESARVVRVGELRARAHAPQPLRLASLPPRTAQRLEANPLPGPQPHPHPLPPPTPTPPRR